MSDLGTERAPASTYSDGYLDLDMLQLLGTHPLAPASATPSDALDRILDNCEFRICPVLKAKLNIGCDTNAVRSGG